MLSVPEAQGGRGRKQNGSPGVDCRTVWPFGMASYSFFEYIVFFRICKTFKNPTKNRAGLFIKKIYKVKSITHISGHFWQKNALRYKNLL